MELLIALIALAVIALIMIGGFAFFAVLLTQGAPFVPSTRRAIQDMLQLSQPLRGKTTIDIGSGAGGIVIAFARAGIEAHGIELNPVLVWWSRSRIRLLGLEDKAIIHHGNLWTFDYAPYDIVTVYGLHTMMGRLEGKLGNELRPSTSVVSNTFRFPNWKPIKRIGTVRLYRPK